MILDMDVRGSDKSNSLEGRDYRGQVLNDSNGGTTAFETKEEAGYNDRSKGEIHVEQEIRVADEQHVRSRSPDKKSHDGSNVGEKKDHDSLDREKGRLCSDGQSSLPEISSDASPRKGIYLSFLYLFFWVAVDFSLLLAVSVMELRQV